MTLVCSFLLKKKQISALLLGYPSVLPISLMFNDPCLGISSFLLRLLCETANLLLWMTCIAGLHNLNGIRLSSHAALPVAIRMLGKHQKNQSCVEHSLNHSLVHAVC